MFERLSTLYMMIVGDYNGNEGVIRNLTSIL